MFGLMILLPLLLLIAIVVMLDSRGGAFYTQWRVGHNNRDFRIIKFRTMTRGADRHGLLTTGSADKRITAVGRVLRSVKLDELPQLINILVGDMSFVGPRPEVRKYVELYTEAQMKVLSVRPGLTDYASIQYIDEEEILAGQQDPEKVYIDEIMPAKLALNLQYIEDKSTMTDTRIMLKTVGRIFAGR